MLLSLWICRFETLLLFRRRAERSYSTFKVRRGGGEEIPLVQSKEQWLPGRRRAKRSYSTFKVRRGGGEEIPHDQGKRNPSKTVDVPRGHQRADTLKP